jgi:WD40 repeat protein
VLVQANSTPAYVGHSQPVTGLSWGTGKVFVSASLDRTVKFWDVDHPDALLTIARTKSETRGPGFPDDIAGVSHFWDDKFVAVASGQVVSLFGFHLPAINAGAKTAVADMHQTGTYKGVSAVGIDSGKVIAMSASNVPSSPIVLVATSAKAIHAVDFYCGEKVLDIETKHERPIHSIVANFGGMYTPRQPGTPDLVMTGGFDETFKLWDLRSSRCERTMAIGGRTVKVGCCFSPDSKFVALGTERLGFEVWDIGQGKSVAKFKDELRGLVVSWLDWNPASGTIHCGLGNGLVKVFG